MSIHMLFLLKASVPRVMKYVTDIYIQNTKRYIDEGHYQCIAENGIDVSEAEHQDGFLFRIWCKCTNRACVA